MGLGWLITYISSSGFGSSLPNFHTVTPRIYRGGLPKKDGYKKLKQIGVTTVINLIEGDQREAKGYAVTAGLRWFQVPLSDKRAPMIEDVRRFLSLVQDGVVFYSCKGGRHRAGLMTAVYRVVVEGWSKEEAWKETSKGGWYSEFGHTPLKEWFFNDFNPADYR